jgi:hypothetical protein
MAVSKSFIWQAILALLVAAASWIGSGVHATAAPGPDSHGAPAAYEAPARATR